MRREREIRTDIALVSLLIVMSFLFLSLLGFGGSVGAALAMIMFGLFGIGAWAVPFYIFAFCYFLITDTFGRKRQIQMAASLLLLLSVQALGHLWLHFTRLISLDARMSFQETFRLCAGRHLGGGIFGGWIAWALYYAFRLIGSAVILLGLLAVAVILLLQRSPGGFFRSLRTQQRERGGPGLAERRAMLRQRRLEEWEEELDREDELEAERILRREDALEQKRLRQAEILEKKEQKRLRRRRSRSYSDSALDLEQILLKGGEDRMAGHDGQNHSSRETGNDSEKHPGRKKRSGTEGRTRKDIHEITVSSGQEETPLTIPSASRRRTQEVNYYAEDFPGSSGSPADPEGTRFRHTETDDHLQGPGAPSVSVIGAEGKRNTKEPAGRAVPETSSTGFTSFSEKTETEEFHTAGPAAGEGRRKSTSAAGSAGFPYETDGSAAAGPGSAGLSEAAPAAGSAAVGSAVVGSAAAGSAAADAKDGTGAPGPTEADLQSISVHREEGNANRAPFAGRRAAAARKNSYIPPTFSLLERGSSGKNAETEQELKETAFRLQETLRTFGVQVTITDISQGPSVTRFELRPDTGVKVSRIVNLSDDIKLRLAATDIRIEAPIPGKSAIGIEVPNKHETTVHLRELLESREFRRSDSKLPFTVGKDIGGKIVIGDIARMPHLLIAGATGSGKSVCINTIILSILYRTSPEDVKLLMIDPKVVELSVYKKIPHLIIPVVTDARKASAALNWAVAEMEKRYKLFAAAGVRDLNGYNALAASWLGEDGEPEREQLPRIIIIVDELADLMMVSKSEVESAICRLAQLARAAGIHLIIATQRPSVDVITGLIKANMPSRIAFAVSSQVDSRTILDMAGAEKLIGKGDMLFYPQNYQKPRRIQGAFVSDDEVTAVVDYIRKHNSSDGHDREISKEIENIAENGISAAGLGQDVRSDPARDEYFAEAGRFIIEKNKASIGLLQRVFKIGFNRAARIMDQLAEAGVVSEESSTRARQVLMSLPEFENYLEQE